MRTRFPFELFVIDNGSSDTSRSWLKQLTKQAPQIRVLHLERNEGGEAFNRVLGELSGDFVLFCENDLEFLVGWDENMVLPFFIFDELGAISPFAPDPNSEIGENWSSKPFSQISKYGYSLNRAVGTLGSTILVRAEFLGEGLRWSNLIGSDGKFSFPNDAKFSRQISDLGRWLAWSNAHQALNWGHVPEVGMHYRDYFEANYKAKADLNIDGMGDLKNMLTSASSERELLMRISQLHQENTFLSDQLRLLRSTHKISGFLPIKDKTLLFYDLGTGFHAHQALVAYSSLGNSEFSVRFEVGDVGSVTRLRWDPLEGMSSRVLLEQVTISVGGKTARIDMDKIHHNGVSQQRHWVYFETNDPMFFIPVSGRIDWVELVGKWELI